MEKKSKIKGEDYRGVDTDKADNDRNTAKLRKEDVATLNDNPRNNDDKMP